MNNMEWFSSGENEYKLYMSGASATLSWDVLHQDWYLQIVEHNADYVDGHWTPLRYGYYESGLEGTLDQKDKVFAEAMAIVKDILHI